MCKKKIELDIECRACGGTGVYVGMGESKGAGVVCYICKGTGKYHHVFEYKEFVSMKKRDNIERVYKSGYGWGIAPKKIDYEGIGEIDMTKEGVSYQEFLEGKRPKHIRQFGCPMRIDQGACHKLKGFTNGCKNLGGLVITSCPNYPSRARCWDLFDSLSGGAQ